MVVGTDVFVVVWKSQRIISVSQNQLSLVRPRKISILDAFLHKKVLKLLSLFRPTLCTVIQNLTFYLKIRIPKTFDFQVKIAEILQNLRLKKHLIMKNF